MRRNPKALCFLNETYGQDFYFLAGWTDLEARGMGLDTVNAAGSTDMINGSVYIWVKDLGCDDAIEYLVHECIHASTFTLGARGIEVSAKNDEAHAYLTQWIFSNCHKLALKHAKKKKPKK